MSFLILILAICMQMNKQGKNISTYIVCMHVLYIAMYKIYVHVFSVVLVFSMLCLVRILISDLVVANLLMCSTAHVQVYKLTCVACYASRNFACRACATQGIHCSRAIIGELKIFTNTSCHAVYS